MARNRDWPTVGKEVIASTSEDQARFRLNRLDGQIRIEYELIGHRMSWLMVSQAFMFAAFATAAHSVASQTWPENSLSITPPLEKILIPSYLMLLVPVVGAISAVLAAASTFAAKSAILKLKACRDQLEKQIHKAFEYDVLGVPRCAWEHRIGNLPSLILPSLFVVTWSFLLVLRFCLWRSIAV